MRLGFRDFSISKNQYSFFILDDVGNNKVDITIEQVVINVSLVRKELRKNLSIHKVSSISQFFNIIVI